MAAGGRAQPAARAGQEPLFDQRLQRDFHVLTVLDQAGEPVGGGTLAERLAAAGLSVGEATAGRWLRELEARGYLRSAGREGRVLTLKGRNYLERLRLQRAHWDRAHELASVLLSLSGQQLIDILVARRALEGEAAALAARHARPEDVAAIAEVVRAGAEGDSDVRARAEHDYAFHYAVADASRNMVIAKTVRMMRSAEPRFPILAHIRESLGHRVLEDHVAIYEAIARGDADAARAAMVEHLDRVIADVEAYRDRGGRGR